MKKENQDFLKEMNIAIDNIIANLKSGLRLGAKDNEDFNSIRRAIQKIEPYMLNNELVRITLEKHMKQLDNIQKRQVVAQKRSPSSPRAKDDSGKKIKIDQLLEKRGSQQTEELASPNPSSKQKKDSMFDDTESEGGGFKRK
jgi:hypothetical protein